MVQADIRKIYALSAGVVILREDLGVDRFSGVLGSLSGPGVGG